ncbi:hypothetical protein N015_16740 [Pseudomonas asturiensis]|uniref:Uncharacterized protein n=1 Tax=Pseudomonas asturiensis TaxID=1190415 RepID=A0ABX6HEE8_9PSED|nr:hypothetical protein [Pseudomonas asturiensis]QHF03970.1 hypothetical protein N015_16740 [Pseudomonas asturiensis]
MARVLPPPKVPDLKQPQNYIDLDLLGTNPLVTYVPDLEEGDAFYPNWRGCAANGAVVDFLNDLIVPGKPPPEGVQVDIKNDLLRELDQGWVFYSYQLVDDSQPDKLRESLRVFFFVGKRPIAIQGLAVPQCKESQGLFIDPTMLGPQILIVTLPYQAMRAGDKVTLTLARYFAPGDPFDSLVRSQVVSEKQVGTPLEWSIGSNELQIIAKGFVEISYSIEYAAPSLTPSTQSPVQKFDIDSSSTPLLPALTIKDFNGGSLDPGAYPQGIRLLVAPYPGLQANDDIVVYATSENRVVKSLHADLSTLDSGVLEFRLAHEWLMDNNGKEIELMYQYARPGAAGSSLPRALVLRRPLNLPPPEIAGAAFDGAVGDNVQGHIFAETLAGGVTVRIPEEADFGPDDQVQMHWDGHGSTGSFIAEPSDSDPKQFFIPAAAVPANMGKRVDVYYKVTPAGELPGTSRVYDLEVRGIKTGWPTIQIMRPKVTDGKISLARVPEEGAGLDLEAWMYMAQGQRVRIRASGFVNGQTQRFDLRTGAAEPVTAAELTAKIVPVIFPKVFLAQLDKLSESSPSVNDVTVEVSFDDGTSYVVFPRINFDVLD